MGIAHYIETRGGSIVNKKKFLLFILLPCVLICGVTYAYMFSVGGTVTNELTPAEVACEVVEETDTGSNVANEKTSITVVNTGDIRAYLRVRIVSHWEDSNGEILLKYSKISDFDLGENWVAGSDNTYYYSLPVESGSATGELLGSNLVIKEESGLRQVIEIYADAVQAEPFDAVKEAWGVSLDSAGRITE